MPSPWLSHTHLTPAQPKGPYVSSALGPTNHLGSTPALGSHLASSWLGAGAVLCSVAPVWPGDSMVPAQPPSPGL
jgi:hypothetical protein